MKKTIIVPLLFIAINSISQQFYFPKSYYADSTALAANVPALARQLMVKYQDSDRINYLDFLLRLQMIAGQYNAANSTLDSLRELIKPSNPAYQTVGNQFEAFNKSKMMMAQSNISFNAAFSVVYDSIYRAFNENNKNIAERYFTNNAADLQTTLNGFLQKLPLVDSIGLDDAKYLCRTYNSLVVYRHVMPPVKSYILAYERSKYIIQDSVIITTKDGATIAATIIRRKDLPAKLPCIFVFNIYNGSGDRIRAKEIANRGYVGIIANTRGKYLSKQTIEPFEQDASDSYDVINWVSQQPWSNGKVGMMGGSYLGFSQWAATKKLHPALKTIIPQVAVGPGIDYPNHNGVFMGYMLRWIHYVTNSKQTDLVEFNNVKKWNKLYTSWYSSGKAFNSLDSTEGRPNNIFQRWLEHPGYDSYWQKMVPYQKEFANINIPILTTTGYFDDDQRGAFYYFDQHHLYNKEANHYMLIGPYSHGGAQGTPAASLRGYKIDPVANTSITSLAYQWFDYVLQDSARPVILRDKINYQVMGSNSWKHAPTLASMNNDTLNFYLSNTRVAQHYKLQRSQPNANEFIKQEVDLKDRSDSNHISFGDPDIIDSSLNVSNGLSFTSEPFTKAFEINGSFIGSLQASINKKDMDIAINLYERMPDGKYFALGYTLFRASYADNRSQRTLLQPNVKTVIPITNTYFTSKRIQPGSRLIVVLGINKNSLWQINYGTGKDVSKETVADATVPLLIKWYCNSVIKVPVRL